MAVENKEQTLVIIKPDAVNRALAGRILSRFEKKGYKIAGIKMEHLEPYKLKEHYAHHADKAFYNELIEFMSSIPSILAVVEGKDVVSVVRKMVGATNGRDAEPGTVRGDFSISNQQNLIHASATTEEAKTEIKRFFKAGEIYDYRKMNFDWIYASTEKEGL